MTFRRRCDGTARRSKPQLSPAPRRGAERVLMAGTAGGLSETCGPSGLAFSTVGSSSNARKRDYRGPLRSKPKNTARGTPWVWRTCGITDFDKPRCREASRSAGPVGPLASRAPSAFSGSGGQGLRAYPALAQRTRAMTHACTKAVVPAKAGTQQTQASRLTHSWRLLDARLRGHDNVSRRALLSPQSRRGDVGALAQRLELEPHRRLDHPFAIGEGAEAAIGGGNHALALADRGDRFLDAARHDFRMLDEIRSGLDHARHQQHVLGQRVLLERRVFVRVARVGELDRQRADLRLIQ